MIKSIKIKNLFQRFNYDIDFNNEGVTLITGPNGFGKSTILKIIDSIGNFNWYFFVKLEFEEIIIKYTTESSNDDKDVKNVEVVKRDGKVFINGTPLPKPSNKDRIRFDEFLRRSQDFIYTHNEMILDSRNGSIYTYDELFLKFLYGMEIDNNGKSLFYLRIRNEMNDPLKKFENLLGKVKLISTQRLYEYQKTIRPERKAISVIETLPNKLKEIIRQYTDEYAAIANSLDSSYPNRLLVANEGLEDNEEYDSLLLDATNKFQKLQEYQLAQIQFIKRQDYDPKYSTALKIYFDDFTEKYSKFEPLIKKMDLFKNVINNRFLFKKLEISKASGFKIFDADDRTKEIDLSGLSSGEQQEIVLFFELIFNKESNYTLLIDEPEISLHILWQKMFLDDLLKIVKDNNIDVILATHSPQIISNHWDMQIDLGEVYDRAQFN